MRRSLHRTPTLPQLPTMVLQARVAGTSPIPNSSPSHHPFPLHFRALSLLFCIACFSYCCRGGAGARGRRPYRGRRPRRGPKEGGEGEGATSGGEGGPAQPRAPRAPRAPRPPRNDADKAPRFVYFSYSPSFHLPAVLLNSHSNRTPSGDTLFVTNLPFSVDDSGLAEIFKGLNIKAAHVVRKHNERR